MNIEGTIYKGIGGFYYVKTPQGELIECKPRGIFRKRGQKPLPGDRVILKTEAGTLYIDEILPRKNSFVRPPVANVDQFFVIASTTEPTPSTLVIDKLLAVALDQEAQGVLLISKGDLVEPDDLLEKYSKSGIQAIAIDALTEKGLDEVRGLLNGKLSVFAGNSGVGKSTLLNALLPTAQRETGEISQKLGRGRHTTREVEIFELAGGLVADTPGFASFDLQSAGKLQADNLQFAFPEIGKRMPDCKFSGCAHLGEKGCAVKQALEQGEISQSRYDSYVTLYKEAKENERY